MDGTQIRTRNRDVVRMLELTLDICSQMAVLQKKWKAEFVYFNTPHKNDYHSTAERFADKLLECVYSQICQKSGGQITAETPSIWIKLEITDGKNANTDSIACDTKICGIKYVGLNDNDGYEEKLQTLLKKAGNSFMNLEQIASLSDKVKCFLDKRRKLYQCENPFPEYSVMEGYLESYYQILTFLMMNEQLLDDFGSDILQLLLNVDCYENSLSLFSPMAMNQLRKMYLGIEHYYKKILMQQDGNAVLELFYKSVISQKVKQSFRWFFYGMNGKLMHAAIDAYDDEGKKEMNLEVRYRDIHQYNSYEGIGELRIAEKILYEIEKCSKSGIKLPNKFKIAVLGDIGANRIKELSAYLNGALPKRIIDDKIKLHITAFSKNFSADMEQYDDRNVIISYRNNLDQVFMDRELLCGILRENEVIFMLDCIKLYCPIYYSSENSLDYLKQNFALGNALNNATQDDIDICSPNLLDKLYELMTVRGYHGRLGRFYKKANDALLKFCEEQVTEEAANAYRTLYVYVSDLTAFENVYCNDQYYMRTERYNQKEIGIIRYTSGKSEQIDFPVSPSQDQGKMICFNIWQIVKHINLEDRNKIIEEIIAKSKENMKDLDKESGINDYDLHSMYVGIDYNDWPEKLSLHYAVVDDESHNIISQGDQFVKIFFKTFIEKIVIPIFNDDRKELFQQYFWRAIYSFLYGDAKNVEEMLLINLLWNEFDELGDVCMADENQPDKVRNNINWDYKYSIKRFIEMIISKFDISASNSMDQMWTEYIINKSNVNAESKPKLFEKVRKACEQIGYTNSYLYRNCKDM